jgi:hypothetical protein
MWHGFCIAGLAMMKSVLVHAPRLFAVSAIVALCSAAADAAPVYWTDWQGTDQDPGVGFIGQGTITTPTSSVTVTYTNPHGVGFYQPSGGADYYIQTNLSLPSPYVSSLVDNRPTGTDIIALRFAGSQTLSFSQTIANPVFSFVSLNGNGYAFFDQDFDILSVGDGVNNSCGYWGCGTVSKVVIDLGGGNYQYELIGSGEPHGTIRFKGAFDTLTWTSLTNEFWNGFTVGVQGTAAEVFVPEPATLAIIGAGLCGVGVIRRRRKTNG